MTAKTISSDSPDFKERNTSYFTAFNNDITPSSIAIPESASEVAQLVKQAVQNNSEIGVRSGGHTPWKGAANREGRLVIDLRDLNGVHVSEDKTTVTVGAGERWGSVYESLAAQGLATTGGRVSRVGVAGLTLGGGLSYFSGRHGFVCDGVKNFEVVLSTGEIVNANNASHPDLFAALKGGSNNFGIVTKIELPAFPMSDLWGGMIISPGTAFPEAAEALHNYITSANPDADAHFLVSYGYAAAMGGEMLITSMYHASHPKDAPPPASLSQFTTIQPQIQASLRHDSVVKFTAEQSQYSVDGGRNLYFTTTIKPDLDLLNEIRTLTVSTIEPIKGAANLAFGIVLQPMTTGMLQNSAAAGRNALGINPADGPYINVLINPAWSDAADDEIIISACQSLLSAIDEAAKKRGKDARYRFMNYSYGTQKVIESYGEESVAFLKKISAEYDPSGFFQKNVPGGFKLT